MTRTKIDTRGVYWSGNAFFVTRKFQVFFLAWVAQKIPNVKSDLPWTKGVICAFPIRLNVQPYRFRVSGQVTMKEMKRWFSDRTRGGERTRCTQNLFRRPGRGIPRVCTYRDMSQQVWCSGKASQLLLYTSSEGHHWDANLRKYQIKMFNVRDSLSTDRLHRSISDILKLRHCHLHIFCRWCSSLAPLCPRTAWTDDIVLEGNEVKFEHTCRRSTCNRAAFLGGGGGGRQVWLNHKWSPIREEGFIFQHNQNEQYKGL